MLIGVDYHNGQQYARPASEDKMQTYKTTAAYISGGICGPIWWPVGALCGRPLKQNARGHWGFMDKGDSFRDALLSLLMKEGGDFQYAQFTADTCICIKRRGLNDSGKYTMHTKTIELANLASCADLVNAEAFTSDFMDGD